MLLLFNKSFFHKKKYGQIICVCFTLGGSTGPPEIPQDPPQIASAKVDAKSCNIVGLNCRAVQYFMALGASQEFGRRLIKTVISIKPLEMSLI